jgi:sulfur transfer protein SufE
MDLSFLKELEGEDYYNSIIELPYEKPTYNIKTPVNKIYGCGSDAWVDVDDSGKVVFESTSIFVTGLLSALSSQVSIDTVLETRFEDYDIFTPEKISMRRYRGLRSAFEKIQNIVKHKYNTRG